MDKLHQDIAEQEALTEKRSLELAKGTTMYRRWLGLGFERVGEDRLRLELTHIDAAQPSRVFSFEVFVDKSNTYHIERCTPEILSLADLVKTLNETNNFSQFVRTIRREFQALVDSA